MKKLIVIVSLIVIFLLLLSACSNIDTKIDLAKLQNDDGTFCYKNLNLLSTFEEAEKIIGYKLKLLYTSEDNVTVAYSIDKDFELLNCTSKPSFEFKNDTLSSIKFTFRHQDKTNDIEELYTKTVEKLTELYPDVTDIIDPSKQAEIGNLKLKIEGYRWDSNSGKIKTSLQVVKIIQSNNNSASMFLSIDILQ